MRAHARHLLRPAAACALVVTLASHPAALDLARAESECPGSSWPWTGQGPVVNVPARIASDPVKQIVGMALALTMVPIDLGVQAVKGKPQDDAPIPKFAHAGLCGGVLLGKGVALAVGAPFRLIKGIFWDAPKALAGGGRQEPAPPPAP